MEQINKRLMNWASILESEAREQALRTSRLPFVHPHVALMPDAHWGMGATVGSVIPTVGAIVPAAVGVDIGCGMIAVQTNVHKSYVEGFDPDVLRRDIERRVPLSPGVYNTGLYDARTQGRIQDLVETDASGNAPLHLADSLAPNWHLQLGSLGGGNHFIEVCLDQDDIVWLFLHSGSRGVGNKLAQHHIKVAKKQAERYHIPLEDPDLAYLIEGDDNFWDYMRDLRWAQKFALLNREEMMDRVMDAFAVWIGDDDVRNDFEVNCHHNYTVQEKHFGKDVWLSRKGAIDASEGTWGLIPGSMGAASYVVRGKGDRLSLNSAPHGAGRALARSQARKTFTHEDLRQRMEGISWRDSDAFLDEHPDAYKDITQVMEDAYDLVSVEHELRQIINVKGE